MVFWVKAFLQHILPLRLSPYVIVEPLSWNGMKHNFVYVHPKLVRQLHEEPAPEERSRYHNAWEYYFLGWGLYDISLEAMLAQLANYWREDDWTFQGDDRKRPIPNLSHLFKSDVQTGGEVE